MNVVSVFAAFRMRSRTEDGLGFDLRIAWRPSSNREMSDLLIIDEKETCSIESYGHGHFGDLEVSVNPVVVGIQITSSRTCGRIQSQPGTACLRRVPRAQRS